MASGVLRSVLKIGEGLATVQVQKSTNTHYGKQSSLPSSQEWRSSCSSTSTNNYQHTMASKVLPPVHKSAETLAAVQVQTTTNTHYGKQSSPPSSQEWKSSCSSTGTNNHQHILWQEKFSSQFSRMEKVLQQYRYKNPPTHTMASRVLRPVLKSGKALEAV